MPKLSLFVMAVALFLVRYWWALPTSTPDSVRYYQGSFIELDAVTESLDGVFSAHSLQYIDQSIMVKGRLKMTAFSRELLPGDRVMISGRLEASFREDPRFDGTFVRPKILVLEKGSPWSVTRNLAAWKRWCEDRLAKLLPDPAASVAAGILMGSRADIPRSVLEDFRSAGLSHILAISGYNIVLVVNLIIMAASYFFPRKAALWCSLAGTVLFVLFVGPSASVVRAALMASLGIFARLAGRKSAGFRTLLVTGFLMLMADPFILWYDVGFQLSFGATAGLMLFQKSIASRLERLPNWFGMRDSLSTTLAAQVFTTPIIMFQFGGVSLIAPLSNLVILPLIPPLMLGSFVSLVVGSLPFAEVATGVTWLGFEMMLRMVHAFASLPGAFIDFGISYT